MARKLPQIVREIQEKKIPSINYAYQKNISYSQYSMWKKCKKHWSLQYRDGHKIYNPSIHASFGTAFHETLQHYLTVMYEKSAAAADREDINGILKENLRECYMSDYKKNNNQHFSKPGDLQEFYDDGVAILDFIKKKRNTYFGKKNWYLVGIETPITMAPLPKYPNVLYLGYLDVVLYHEPSNTFKIIDIKTSTNGWKDKMKKDEDKQFQLVLYKKFFVEQFGVPKENIDIEFLIVRRKIYTGGDFPQKRIQEFKPPSGKIKMNRATKSLNDFIEECFTSEGFTEDEMSPNPSKWNCTFCPYKDKKELCNVGINS